MIIIVIGLPGSGKSYFARRLAKRINADYIGSDRVRLEMYDKRTYSDEEKKSVYVRMLSKAKESLARGMDVVVDGTFYKRSFRKDFQEAFNRERTWFIEVRADESLVEQRLGKRRELSEANFAVYTKIKLEWEPLDLEHLVLQSSNDNIDDMIASATAYITGHNDTGGDQ